MKKKVSPIFSKTDLSQIETLEEKDMEGLPMPVQKYLLFSNVPGKEKIKTVKLKQRGLFFVNGKKWMPMKAEQYFNVDSKEFIWKAKAGIFSVVDQFLENKGALIVKLLGFIKIGEARGEEVDQGEIQRYLSEAIWFPSAFVSDFIEWKTIDKQIARAIINYEGKSASVDFHFGPNGAIDKITAKRYRALNGKFELSDWEISNLEYKAFNGILIPYKAHVNWKLEEGDMCYYKMEITDIRYNELSVH